MKPIIQKISKTVAGLHIWIDSTGDMVLRLVILSKDKKSFKILFTETYNDISEAIKKIPARSPLIVSVCGYGIIHKSVDKKDIEEGITKVLPNAKISELYIQKIYQEKTEKVIFSVGRKDKIDEIITTLNDLKFFPYNITLGPFGIINLLPLISPDEKIETPRYTIEVRDRTILSFCETKKNYTSLEINFGDQVLLSEYLVAFSNCLGFFAPTDLLSNNISAIEKQQQEFTSKKLLYILGLSIPAIIFLILTINMFLLSKYSSENRLLNQRIQYGHRLMKDTDSLKKILSVREAFIEKSGNNSLPRMSYFSDRIASIIPQSIALERLNVYPLETASNNRNMTRFRENAIIMTGNLNSSEALEILIKRSSTFNWIKTADLINYLDAGADPPYFTIEIKIE